MARVASCMEPMMRRVWTVFASAAVTAVLAAAPVAAQDDGATTTAADASTPVSSTTASGFQRTEERAPRAGTPLIANKLYPMAGRFEFTGMFDLSFGDKYTEHLGGHAAVSYHFLDFLSLEVFGGYLQGDETGIVDAVRQTGASANRRSRNEVCAQTTCEPQLPDMWQSTWFAGANVQWAPIYGKLSAVSEYDLNFQLYLRAGAGAEGIQQLLNDASYSEARVRASVNYGLGVRLIPWKHIAIRAELVNYTGINPNVVEHDPAQEASCSDGYIQNVGTAPSCLTDFSQSTMFQVGLSFLL